MTRRDIPNLITLARILLVAPLCWVLLEERYGIALWLFALAGISDGIDGFLARRFGWSTRLGSILDPIADKLLLMGTYLSLGWGGLLPVWLVALVVLRDVVIVGGALAYHLFIGRFEMEPSRASKVNTFFQILLVLALVVGLTTSPLPPWLLDGLIYAVLVTMVLSGVNYVWVWSRRALRAQQGDGDE